MEPSKVLENIAQPTNSFDHKKIALDDIKYATKNFAKKNLIREGGFGKVYKGTLLVSGKLISIAARRLHYDYGQGDMEFWREISVFASDKNSLKHENLVSFIGFCYEKGVKIIIYKLEAKGSLDAYLSDPKTLPWMKRLHICVGLARALKYIHGDDEHDSSIIHRNIKSSKIFLDDNWNPKLSGFEHSKTNTRARKNRLVLDEIIGTIGYVDPSYEKTGFVTHKSDIFSLGVVLFEILCGKRAFTPDEKELLSPQFSRLDEVDTILDTEDASSTSVSITIKNSSLKPPSSPRMGGSAMSFTGGRASSFGGDDSGDDIGETQSKEKEKPFKLHPLFTMKRLDQYQHSPTKELTLLSQLAITRYEEGKLEELIDPILREKMDPESYKIFAGTAYNCLKEQRAQRPNIDQILRNLVRAWQLQKKLENPEVADEVGGKSASALLKGGKLDYLKIPLIDIELATDNFTKIFLGAGGYAKVYGAELEVQTKGEYMGELPKKQKKVVAIKCITKSKQGEVGFIKEIELLTRCEHPNIVTLVGFCNEGDELILVYEHLSNGSLDNYLGTSYNSNNLTWLQRLNISIDIARGLNYLHTSGEDEHSIIHRDIKSGNILLGKNWTAKIADFGLSKFHEVKGKEKTHYSKNAAGTEIYICPEYLREGRLKRAIDIYSFGVVLFEILSGKLAYQHLNFLDEGNQYGIAHIARELYKQQKIQQLVDPQIMEEVDELTSSLFKGPNPESLATFIEIAYKCVAVTQNARPTAEEILKELEKALLTQENNKPTLEMSFQEIKSATENFKNYLSGGGFGRVYKGEITYGDKCNIVVAKRLDKKEGQGEREFLTELEILLEYKHENIIALAGYCKEKKERIILYEYACKGSLDRHLKDATLKWTERLKICIDVARGLAFLHGGSLTREMVIHRDIKCTNILLDGDWKAKISDFGLSAITAFDQEVVSELVGTHGYVDPVYGSTGFFTNKSDIYSFGVVLFEVLSGKLLVPTKTYDKQHVAKILEEIHEEGKLDSIVFKDIKEGIVQNSLSAFRVIVSRCLDNDRKKRPTAEEVLVLLQKALELQLASSKAGGGSGSGGEQLASSKAGGGSGSGGERPSLHQGWKDNYCCSFFDIKLRRSSRR